MIALLIALVIPAAAGVWGLSHMLHRQRVTRLRWFAEVERSADTARSTRQEFVGRARERSRGARWTVALSLATVGVVAALLWADRLGTIRLPLPASDPWRLGTLVGVAVAASLWSVRRDERELWRLDLLCPRCGCSLVGPLLRSRAARCLRTGCCGECGARVVQ